MGSSVVLREREATAAGGGMQCDFPSQGRLELPWGLHGRYGSRRATQEATAVIRRETEAGRSPTPFFPQGPGGFGASCALPTHPPPTFLVPNICYLLGHPQSGSVCIELRLFLSRYFPFYFLNTAHFYAKKPSLH